MEPKRKGLESIMQKPPGTRNPGTGTHPARDARRLLEAIHNSVIKYFSLKIKEMLHFLACQNSEGTHIALGMEPEEEQRTGWLSVTL